MVCGCGCVSPMDRCALRFKRLVSISVLLHCNWLLLVDDKSSLFWLPVWLLLYRRIVQNINEQATWNQVKRSIDCGFFSSSSYCCICMHWILCTSFITIGFCIYDLIGKWCDGFVISFRNAVVGSCEILSLHRSNQSAWDRAWMNALADCLKWYN